MKKFTITTATIGALAATALGLAGVAGAAATPFAGSAADTVKTAHLTDAPRDENPYGTGTNPLVPTGANPYVPFYPGNDLAF